MSNSFIGTQSQLIPIPSSEEKITYESFIPCKGSDTPHLASFAAHDLKRFQEGYYLNDDLVEFGLSYVAPTPIIYFTLQI